MRLRHQLAAYSPVRADAALRALLQAARVGADPRDGLASVMRAAYDAPRVLLTGSGTQALQIAIAARLAQSRSDVVALPAYTCYDVASAAVGAGARIALYDVDPHTLGPDCDSLARALAGGARVAVIANLYGVPIPWDAVDALARAHGALLVEDASQGHGATWRGTPLGALGGLSTVSFGRGKGWSGGNGGAVLGRDGDAPLPDALPARSAADDVKVAVGLAAQWTLGRPSVYGLPRAIPQLGLGETVYKPPTTPVAMTRGAAAVALASQAASVREGEARRHAAAQFVAALGKVRGVTLPLVPDGGEAGWLRFPVLLADRARAHATLRVLEPLGIGPAYPTTLAALAVVNERLVGPERVWPGAEALTARIVTLPAHSLVGDEERRVSAQWLVASNPSV